MLPPAPDDGTRGVQLLIHTRVTCTVIPQTVHLIPLSMVDFPSAPLYLQLLNGHHGKAWDVLLQHFLPSCIGATFSPEMTSLSTLKTWGKGAFWGGQLSGSQAELSQVLIQHLLQLLHSVPQLPYLALSFTISITFNNPHQVLHCRP